MSDDDATRLAAACRATAEVARDAVGWFEDPANQGRVGQERAALGREFRRFTTTARKAELAVGRPMCVGVFGPSQAGKSYLVSVLAAPSDRPLRAVFEGFPDGIDFISEINPVGEKESTGLVTRFSVRPQGHPPGYPVCLRLLTAADIVKIIGNTFFLDGDLKVEPVPTAADIEAALGRARAAAGPGPRPGLTDEDVWDIQDYFERQFAGTPYLGPLAGFWDEAAALAPKLDVRGRTELFGLLWGRHERFSGLCATLFGALEALGHPADAFCPIDALLPRERSIIDVATLGGLGRDGGQDTLEVRTAAGGPAARLPRPLVTALTAELRIVMAEQPWPFFAHTDLLDFPGARSRQPLALAEFLQREEGLKETFLRGKVAYLFDRYVAEQELASMLLCIKPSAQEVTTLPNMIDAWIATTHGASPAERVGKPCVLFFVLTMFDTHFTEKAGGDSDQPGTRFRNRLEASLLGFFGKAHEWPRAWTPGTPFRNCHWLRNPNYPAETIIEYEEDPADRARRREVRLRPDREDYIKKLRTAYLDVPEVKAHFLDPERAWDEALKLNDGGVGYLAAALEPVCSPAIKLAQVEARLAGLRERMTERLRRFHVSDDVEERLEQRLAVAARIVDELYRAADLGRFGHLIRALQVSADDLSDVLYQVEARPPEDTVIVVRAPAAPGGAARRPRPLPPGAARPAAPGAEAAAPGGNGQLVARTREQVLADASIRHWMERLHKAGDNARLCHALHVDPASVAELTGELIGAAKRLALAHQVAEAIRRFTYIERSDPAKPALLASTLINRFVSHTGFERVPPEARPRVEEDDGAARPVFAPRPIAHDARPLGREPLPYTDTYVTDWVFAFVQLVRDNATDVRGQTVDLEQNMRLGRLIRGLAAAA